MSGDYGFWWHKKDYTFYVMVISNTKQISYYCRELVKPEKHEFFEEMERGHYLVAPEGFNEW